MITIYPYENSIQYQEKTEIKEFIMSPKSMQYGKIKNIPIFEENLSKLIKQEKWVTLFKSKSIRIILPIHYEEIDKEIITVILNNLGIKNIKYIKETNLLEIKNNQIILNVHETYITMIKKSKKNTINYFYPANIFPSIEHIIKNIIKENSSKYRYIFLGSNTNIPKMIENQENNNLFYYKNYKNYYLTKYIP